MQFWIYIWTGVWLTSLVVFSFLAALILVFGAIDLVTVFRSPRSDRTQEDEQLESQFQAASSRKKTAS
jgi:hypothetical protein